MCRSPVLIQPDVDKQFTLHVDASAYGMGTILSQEGNHTTKTLAQCYKPVLHPVAYYSATFTPTEQNYNIYERELLAVMKTLAHWRHYLGWTKTPFIICTNHANLQYWKSPRNPNCHMARWHADLQKYNYILEYISRKTNTAADCWDGHLHGKSWTGQSHTQGFSRTSLDITKGPLNAPGQLWTIYGHREHMLAHGLTGLVCSYIPRTIWLCPYSQSMDYLLYMRPIIVWSDCFRVACLLMILTIP